MNKMFALLSLDDNPRLSLKCDPERAVELREQYDYVLPGYHLNKQQWNTIVLNSVLQQDMLLEWIDHSYALIVASLPKKSKEELENL